MNELNYPGFYDFYDSAKDHPDYKEMSIYFLYDLFLLKIKKDKKKIKDKSKFVFITIQDFQRRLTELDKFTLFFKRIDYLYEEGTYCLEAGKVPIPNCNLHIHMLVRIKNSRCHKAKLRLEWLKLFNTDISEKDFYNIKQHRNCDGMPPYSQWIEQKLEYFDQEKKGEHSNVIDLNIRGIFGQAPEVAN